MTNLLRKFATLLLAVPVITLGIPLTASAQANPGELMDDAVFNNQSSMSAAQIDAFLNSFPNSCISPSSGFTASDPIGYNPYQGFMYGSPVSAGHVLYDAAQAYQINPRLLISMLEAEQGLVDGISTNGCSNTSAYAAAMGYDCPDSGTTHSISGINLYLRYGVPIIALNNTNTCVTNKNFAGFSQQITHAAWLLEFAEHRSEGNTNWAIIQGSWDNSDDLQTCYGGPMTQGAWQRCPSGPTVFYDGYITVDGTTIHMENGATASLYNYSPHLNYNQRLIDIFSKWFGSPLSQPPSATILLDGKTSETVAYGSDVQLTWSSQNVFNCTVTPAYMSGISGSETLTTVTTSQTYSVNCSGPQGDANATASLTVLPPTISYLQNLVKTDLATYSSNASLANGIDNQLAEAGTAHQNGNDKQAEKLIDITVHTVNDLANQKKIYPSAPAFYQAATQALVDSWQ